MDTKIKSDEWRKKHSEFMKGNTNRRKEIDMTLLAQLKREGKTNKDLAEFFGINQNLLGEKVRRLIEEGQLQKTDIKKESWNKGICYRSVVVKCVNCDKEKNVPLSMTKNHGDRYFCNRECEREYYSKNKNIVKRCELCGKDYIAKLTLQKYCSNKCKMDSCRDSAIVNCKEKYTSERRSQVLKEKWNKDKEEMLKKRNTDEYREKLLIANKEKWTDELRKKHSEVCKASTTPEKIQKIKESWNKVKESVSERAVNRWNSLTDQEKEKFSELIRLGFTEEIRRKISISSRNYKNSLTDQEKKEIWIKGHETKKQNGSYNTPSKFEIEVNSLLEKNFKEVIAEFVDEKRYPFSCDFYIPEIDLFVECQGTWTHGERPYNGKSIPEEWVLKSIDSEYYKVALKNYVESDPLKREYAKNNKLNYLELWDIPSEEYLLVQIDRVINGLEIIYTKDQLSSEIKAISTKRGDYRLSPQHNKIVLTYQPHFYEMEKELWKDEIIKRSLIENRCKYLDKNEDQLTDNELLRGFKISGIRYGFSHFSPFWIKAFIEKYNIKSIYDPCAGWGHRLLGAHDIIYIGNDIDERTCHGLQNMIIDFNLKDKKIYNKDSSLFIPEEQYEAVFTCPPYFKTEDYTHKESSHKKFSQLDDWLFGFWRQTVKNSLVNCSKYFAFVISQKYKDKLKSVCEELGLIFVEEIVVGDNQSGSHFHRHNEVNRKREILVTYRLYN